MSDEVCDRDSDANTGERAELKAESDVDRLYHIDLEIKEHEKAIRRLDRERLQTLYKIKESDYECQ